MGINSTEVAYGFGQLGSGFTDGGGAVTAPAGKVIVAMQFLEDTTLTALVSDTSQGDDVAFFNHAAKSDAGNGSGSTQTDNGTIFPAGITIFGRWKSFTPAAESLTGGIIFYFGK